MSRLLDVIGQTQFDLAYAGSIVDEFDNFFNENEVVVLDQDGNDIFENVNILNVRPTKEINFPSHKMESGASLSDHSYEKSTLEPFSYACTDPEAHQRIDALFLKRTTLTAQSYSGTTKNVFISKLAVLEQNKVKRVFTVTGLLKEIRIAETRTVNLPAEKVSKPRNQGVIKKGTVNNKQSNNPKPVDKGSLAIRAAEKIGRFFK